MGLIVDLSGVTYLDSRGLHLLFELAERLRVRDQQLHVVVPESALIRNMLKLTQFGLVAPVFATVKDAVDEMLTGSPLIHDEFRALILEAVDKVDNGWLVVLIQIHQVLPRRHGDAAVVLRT